MNKLGIDGESPIHPSNEVVGQNAIGGPDEETEAQACSQDQAGSVQSLRSLCLASLEQSTHPEPKEEEEGEVISDEECRDIVKLFDEFIELVMDEDYALADELCQIFFIYGPDNPKTKIFLLLLDKELHSGKYKKEDESSDDTEYRSDSSDSRSFGNSDRLSMSEDEEDRKKKHKDCPPRPGSY